MAIEDVAFALPLRAQRWPGVTRAVAYHDNTPAQGDGMVATDTDGMPIDALAVGPG